MEINDLTRTIIGAAVEVQMGLGPGLLESAYAGALARELDLLGLRFRREVAIQATYKGTPLGVGYRMDFVVEEAVVLELKTAETTLPIHRMQLLSYLRLARFKIGLLVNFHAIPLVRGIHRVVNNL